MDGDATKCVAVLRNRFGKMKEVSSFTKASTNVSTCQEAGRCSASES